MTVFDILIVGQVTYLYDWTIAIRLSTESRV